jgi:GxxExxY protein
MYDGVEVELAYRLDVLVDDEVIVELKTVAKLLPIHEAQLLSYLKLSRHRVGLLINFREVHLKDGIKRMVHGLRVEARSKALWFPLRSSAPLRPLR